MNTALVHHPIYREHDTPDTHPERPERYDVVIDALKKDAALWDHLLHLDAVRAPRGDIQACHTPQHYKSVERAVSEGLGYLDADTVVSLKSMDAALYGAGGACAAAKAVMEGQARNAFVAVRPPGHHATQERAMGFCIFNNVAVATRYVQSHYPEVKRVAIVDWDVHHGNGTQGIFYLDPDVFFFSMHQYPWYPGSGSRGETGSGRGRGATLNVPVRASTPAAEQLRMFEAAIEEISARFKPDFVFISAGFDAHRSDPLGQLKLEDDDFNAMTRIVKQWAAESCGGRIVSGLEGGYNLGTLGGTVKGHVATLAED